LTALAGDVLADARTGHVLVGLLAAVGVRPSRRLRGRERRRTSAS
jgi:hypothetical protein